MAAKLAARSVSVNTGLVRREVRINSECGFNGSVVHDFLLDLLDVVGDRVSFVSVDFVVFVGLVSVFGNAFVRALWSSASFGAWWSVAGNVVLAGFQTSSKIISESNN